MALNRREAIGSALLLAAAGGAASAPPAPAPRGPDATISLWTAGPPGAPATLPAERIVQRSQSATPDRAVELVANPRMDWFRPAKPNGGAVLICPGGGYQRVVMDHEGYALARLLATHGYHAFVLFYRLPGDGWAAGADVALQDAQRAMRLIRAQAVRAQAGIDAARVGVLGFSAGGHLAADLATRFARQTYAVVDAADRESARPSLAAPIYPVITMAEPHTHMGSRRRKLGENPSAAAIAAHSADRNVTAETPPTFLVHAEDDDVVPVENSLLMRAALKAAGVPVETHLFEKGGHGFGFDRLPGLPAELWPELFLRFARAHGLAG